MDSDSSDDLLAKQAIHDPRAFSELYRRHVTPIYRYILSRAGNEDDAQDLTMTVFMVALEKIANYRQGHSFRAWLIGIANHKLADHFRHNNPVTSIDWIEDIPSAEPFPDDQVIQRQQVEQVVQALNKLTPDRAEALRLRVWGGLKASEIADIMGKSESAVKMLVSRAWRDLRGELQPLLEGDDA